MTVKQGQRWPYHAFEQFTLRPRSGQDANAQENAQQQARQIVRRLRAGNGAAVLAGQHAAPEKGLDLYQDSSHGALEVGVVR